MPVIRLGETDYTLDRLPLRKAATMRQKIRAELDPVFDLVGTLKGLDASSPDAVASALRDAALLIVDLPERLFCLLCEYSPAVQADREVLLDTAFDEQVFHGFVEVLQALFPLAEIGGLLNGLTGLETSKNLPGPSGGSPQKTLTK